MLKRRDGKGVTHDIAIVDDPSLVVAVDRTILIHDYSDPPRTTPTTADRTRPAAKAANATLSPKAGDAVRAAEQTTLRSSFPSDAVRKPCKEVA
jgi:hypothetical protein